MWCFQFNNKHVCRNFEALFENFVMEFQSQVLMPTIRCPLFLPLLQPILPTTKITIKTELVQFSCDSFLGHLSGLQPQNSPRGM